VVNIILINKKKAYISAFHDTKDIFGYKINQKTDERELIFRTTYVFGKSQKGFDFSLDICSVGVNKDGQKTRKIKAGTLISLCKYLEGFDEQRKIRILRRFYTFLNSFDKR